MSYFPTVPYYDQLVVNWPRSVERPEDNVIIFKSELTTSGHIKPPYAKTAVKMVRAATEVPVSGNMILSGR